VTILSSKKELPDLIPLEVLLGNPEKMGPQISPDGKRIAYLAPVNDILNVWVGDVGSEDFRPITKDAERGIPGFIWAHDNKHILYPRDQGGDENWRVFAVDPDTGNVRDLTPFENVQAQLIGGNKKFPDKFLIGLNKENPQLHDAYELTISTGELKLVAKNPGNVLDWTADADLQVRAARAALPDGGFELQVRKEPDSEFETILTWSSDDALSSAALGFTKDGNAIYLNDARDANATRLVKLNLETGDIEVIAEDPQYDVGGALINPDTREPEAVSFIRDRLEWQVLDPSLQGDFDAIRALEEGDFGVMARDHADKNWLIGFIKDDGPDKFYAFDRTSKEGTFLFDHRPDLSKYTLAKMEPFSFESRDGLMIHGYVTFPPRSDKKNLPLVLNVHGGPWGRDVWGFSPDVQWFANRGYACLQVNFRGSTGYGKDFVNAGDREWGGKMHDDLVDAVNFAVSQRWADPKKVAIFGGSYGGYAALVGATFTPDLFCCAVDIVGPSSLKTLIESIPPYWSAMLSTFYKRIGHPEEDEEFLWSRSPLSKVENIRIPLLIGQGANDPRVKQAESEQIVAAMKEKGIDHEYIVFPDEGHGFMKAENRLKFYRHAEKFLAKHLGGRTEE
jgi:dipeptidyl aminopeptidase/acylaminoacyl peptidase